MFLSSEWWLAQKLAEQPRAKGGVPYQKSTVDLGSTVDLAPTITELLGDKKYAWRIKQIAPLTLEALESYVAELHRGDAIARCARRMPRHEREPAEIVAKSFYHW